MAVSMEVIVSAPSDAELKSSSNDLWKWLASCLPHLFTNKTTTTTKQPNDFSITSAWVFVSLCVCIRGFSVCRCTFEKVNKSVNKSDQSLPFEPFSRYFRVKLTTVAWGWSGLWLQVKSHEEHIQNNGRPRAMEVNQCLCHALNTVNH